MAQVVQEVPNSNAAEVRSRDLIGLGATLGIGAGLIEAAMATIRSGRTALLIGRGWRLSLDDSTGRPATRIEQRDLPDAARAGWLPACLPLRVILTIVGTIVFLSPVFFFQRMHRLAALVLRAGNRVSARSLAHSARRPNRAHALDTLPLVADLLDRGRTGIESGQVLRERAAIRRLPRRSRASERPAPGAGHGSRNEPEPVRVPVEPPPGVEEAG